MKSFRYVLCFLALHDWLIQEWSVEEEKDYFQQHGELRPLIAYCWGCGKKKVVR